MPTPSKQVERYVDGVKQPCPDCQPESGSEGEGDVMRAALCSLREQAVRHRRKEQEVRDAEKADRESGKLADGESYEATWNYHQGLWKAYDNAADQLRRALPAPTPTEEAEVERRWPVEICGACGHIVGTALLSGAGGWCLATKEVHEKVEAIQILPLADHQAQLQQVATGRDDLQEKLADAEEKVRRVCRIIENGGIAGRSDAEILEVIRDVLESATAPWPPHQLRQSDLSEELAEKDREIQRLRRECDLAVAHDRQAYPTADAYEKVCAARNKWQERAEKAAQERDSIEESYRRMKVARTEALQERDDAQAKADRHLQIAGRENKRRREAEPEQSKAFKTVADAAQREAERASKLEGALNKLMELREWCRRAAKCPDEEEPGRADAYRIIVGTSYWDQAAALQAQHSPEEGGGDGDTNRRLLEHAMAVKERVCVCAATATVIADDLKPTPYEIDGCAVGAVVSLNADCVELGGFSFVTRIKLSDVRGAWLRSAAPDPCPHCSQPDHPPVPKCDGGHHVEIEFDGFPPSIRLIHPEFGCPRGEEGEDCFLTDWLENEGAELLRGKLTLPVRWEAPENRDHPLFHVLAPNCQPTDTASQPDGLSVADQFPWGVEVSDEAVKRVAEIRRERGRAETLPWSLLPDVAKAPILIDAKADLEAAASYLTPPVSGLSDQDRERLHSIARQIERFDLELALEDAAFLRNLADKTPEPEEKP